MKKLLYTLLLLFILFSNSIKVNEVAKVREGVSVIDRCCKELSKRGGSGKVLKTDSEAAESASKVSSVLPAYFWDTKSMIW